jgi:hypothetical protein
MTKRKAAIGLDFDFDSDSAAKPKKTSKAKKSGAKLERNYPEKLLNDFYENSAEMTIAAEDVQLSPHLTFERLCFYPNAPEYQVDGRSSVSAAGNNKDQLVAEKLVEDLDVITARSNDLTTLTGVAGLKSLISEPDSVEVASAR